MKCQEVVLMVTSLLSILSSTGIILCLLSISLPNLFTGVPLAQNLNYLEALLQEELVRYNINIDIRQYRGPVITLLYTLSGFTVLESILLILGVKSRVSTEY